MAFGFGETVGTAKVRLEVDRSGFNRDWSRAQGDVRSGTSRMAGHLLSFAKVGVTALAGVSAAFAGMAIFKGAQRAVAIDDAERKLKGLGYTAKQVAKITDNALKAVLGTPYSLAEAMTVASSALAAGIKPGQQLSRYLGEVADTATIAGSSLGDVGQILNGVIATQRVYTDDLNQLAQRGLPVFSWLQKEYDVTGAKLAKMVSQGKVDADTLLRVIRDNIGGAAQKAGEGIRGSFANLMTAIARLGDAFLGPTFGSVPKFLQSVRDRVDGLTERIKPLGDALGRLFRHLQRAPTFTAKVRVVWEGLARLTVNALQASFDALFRGHDVAVKAEAGKILRLEHTDSLATEIADAIIRGVEGIDWGAVASAAKRGGEVTAHGFWDRFKAITRNEQPGDEKGGGAGRFVRFIGLDPNHDYGRDFNEWLRKQLRGLEGFLVRGLKPDFGGTKDWLVQQLGIGALPKTFESVVSGVKGMLSDLGDAFKRAGLTFALDLAEPFSHLPGKLGGWARDAKDRINAELEKIRDQDVNVTAHLDATGTRLIISGPGGTQSIAISAIASHPSHRGGAGGAGAHARGGRIPGRPTRADSVPAMLSPGEFVVTGGGERMLETMTFPGVLNWLARRQPSHFQTGGWVGNMAPLLAPPLSRQENAALSVQIPAAVHKALAVFASIGGMANTGHLVPQVLRALSWARGHGWGGSVTSGYRTYAQQAALYAHYKAFGWPIAAAPGTSSHEFGQAVDVTDYLTFGGTMGSAPASSRLYSRVAGDPVHFSVSGYRGGGRVESWRPEDFGLHRHRSEGHRHWQRRLHRLDVGSLPARFRFAQARAALTPSPWDDIRAARHVVNWWRRGRKTGWLSTEQRITVLESLRGALDDLKGLVASRREARQESSTALGNALSNFFQSFASNIFGIGGSNGALTFGSQALGGPLPTYGPQFRYQQPNLPGRGGTPGNGHRSVTVVQNFHRPPEDLFPLMRSAQFAAEAALG